MTGVAHLARPAAVRVTPDTSAAKPALNARASQTAHDEQQPVASFHSLLSELESTDDAASNNSGDSTSATKDSKGDAKADAKGNVKDDKEDTDSTNATAVPIELPAIAKDVLPITLTILKAVESIEKAVEPIEPHKPESLNTISPIVVTDVLQGEATNVEASQDSDDAKQGGRSQSDTSPIPAAPQVDAQEAGSLKGDLAFAAKLTPDAGDAAPQVPNQPKATAAGQKPISNALSPSSVTPRESSADTIRPIASNETSIKTAAVFSQENIATHVAPPARIDNTPSVNAISPAARLEEVIDLRPGPSTSASDITVHIADSDRGTDVRFVERAGEVHVSVKTSHEGMAQTLRSGLNDFAARLEQGGIKTELWRPGSDSGSDSSQDHTGRKHSDQRGSQRNAADAGHEDAREDANRNSKKPKWVEALELSIGRQG